MQIRRVTASNFRGIRQAEWPLPRQRFLCLVGPGDSTKTTLLDVIALVLTSRPNVVFTDADFHQCDTSKPITLRVLIGDLSDDMVADTVFGMWLTGLRDDGELEHDPSPESEHCLQLQLTVDQDLEPSWTVVRHEEYDDGLPLTSGKRRALGLFRVDDRVETHLRWGRGSALARLTDGGTSQAVTAVQRASRNAVFDLAAPELQQTARQVAIAAGAIGGGRFDLRPGWDPVATASPSALLLHDGTIPLSHAGLGTRRLISIAAQELATVAGDILVVDEIEHGLEPHRLLHVLHQFRKRSEQRRGQVIITTHSPIAVQALAATDICVVQNIKGTTLVRPVPPEITDAAQAALRAGPSAILARKVVVGEGATEAGILRAVIRCWDDKRIHRDQTTHAALGVTFFNGGGSTAPVRAKIYQELGIPAMLLVDNDDRGADKAIEQARDIGVNVARWQLGNSTEAEIILSLDQPDLVELLAVAVEYKGAEAVSSHLRAELKNLPSGDELSPQAWQAAGYAFEQVRAAVAVAAGGGQDKDPGKRSKKAWFKREDAGELLGEFIVRHWTHYQHQHLGRELTGLQQFIYGDEERHDSDQ